MTNKTTKTGPAGDVGHKNSLQESEKTEKSTKEYTDQEIVELTSDYLNLAPSFWDQVPRGSHIRYVRRDDGSNKPRNKRFRTGGFIKIHGEKDGKKYLILENKPNGTKALAGYVQFSIGYSDIEELWKKYDRFSYIEIHLTGISLKEKEQEIKKLLDKVNGLEHEVLGIKELLYKMAQSRR